MPPIGWIFHRNLIRNLKRLGWAGPYPDGKHQFMSKGDHDLPIPNRGLHSVVCALTR
jgi:hypothetical protein